jgi:hypothetical protein
MSYSEKEIKNHKCYNCPWGSFVGTKFVCMLPRCVKGGDFKNDMEKKNT